MTWTVLILGTVMGCLCGMAIYNQIEEWKDKHR